MNNPQILYHSIDPSTIYQYQMHHNIPWGMHQYITPRQQVNVSLQIQKRKWQSQKKGQKPTTYVTKKGFYMDDLLKIKKTIPSTFDHGSQYEWSSQKMKNQGKKHKVDLSLKKNTYLEMIQLNQQKRKSPGISTYKLQKSLKQLEGLYKKQSQIKRLVEQKRYFYQNIQDLSNSIPGAGNYSPHQITKRISPQRHDYKYWVDKHKKEVERIKKVQATKPSSFTYETQLNKTIQTFDTFKTNDFTKSKRRYFGGDSKFEYTRPNKKKIFQKRPSPQTYKTIIDWKGKGDSPKKTIWNNLVWKGSPKSIYH